MNLGSVKAVQVPRRKRKRKGMGRGTGQGKRAGRGQKGYRSRTGGGEGLGVREGGQMPLYRRLPKRGFHNLWRKAYTVINVDTLNRFADGATVGPEEIREAGLTPKNLDTGGLKVLGRGDLERKLTVRAHQFSASAREKIVAAGGEAQLIEKTGRKARDA